MLHNRCPAHASEWVGRLNGHDLYQMVRNDDPLGRVIYYLVHRMKANERAAEANRAKFIPAEKSFVPTFSTPSAADRLMLEFAASERSVNTPGQRGLIPF